ncbi:Small nuclear ribonucleoprotein SmG, putative [Penicillium digitatum Pd1]|uniref:Small nuclear ribonucleoprotein G n=1 Tax=Penicillium digitatum (strain Pd1 / CECT 20795) TaxID=1170230 RepID=K9GHX8_PEND1|nr:Small nuclear ribonucleoprotein SmG, putative [Penicillium digitatum Pd1]EKV21800.1 Small nuclear ribonucleoprotein SmG, putative [Penicillium digitatum Pd1]
MPQAQPELKKVSVSHLMYMEKRVFCQLNGNRKVIGVLRGYDVFMNIVLDEAFEEKDGGEKVSAGMVVRSSLFTDAKNPANACRYQVIRGNSIVMLEALERITDK